MQEHTKSCPDGHLHLHSVEKTGFELVDAYQCSQCTKILIKQSSGKSKKNPTKRVPFSPDINVAMSAAMFTNAISPMHMEDLCSTVGIVHSTRFTMMSNNKNLKNQIKELSDEQLKEINKNTLNLSEVNPDMPAILNASKMVKMVKR